MKHTEYVEFFRDIARTHPDLLHSDTEMHFGRLVITRDPLMGSQHQINEFLHHNGSKLKYPCMLLVAFRGDYADNRSDNKRKRMDGSFILLDKVREGDHDGEEAVFDRMETLGEEIASICIDHFEDNPGEGIFDVNVMENEKIAKVANDKFGVKFYFGIDKSADALLSEPLPQEKINGIADLATYKNSDGSFVKEISAGSIYTAPDVVHTDSDGSLVPTPANVAFVAIPADLFSFAGAELSDDNTYVDLYFTEAAYNTALAAGALEVADLALTFTQNGGDATAASISSLKKLDGTSALEGGEIGIRVFLSITGTPSGVETIAINPVADSIFNVDGNAMATSESETVTLNQLYSKAVQEVINNIESGSGETLTDAEISKIEILVDAEVTAGNWVKYKYFRPIGVLSTYAKARVDWIGGIVAGPVSSPTYDVAGVAFSGANHEDLGFNPVAAALDFNSHTLITGFVEGTLNGGAPMGAIESSTAAIYFQTGNSIDIRYQRASGSSHLAVWGTNSINGFLVSGRAVSVTDTRIYSDSTLQDTNVEDKTTFAFPNKNIFLGAINNTTGASHFFTGKVNIYAAGDADIDLATLKTNLNTYFA